LFIPMFVQ